MSTRKKELFLGSVMLISFIVVFIIFMSPIFNGQNGLDYLDNLYNSISKSSSYYIPKLKKNLDTFEEDLKVNITIDLDKKDIELAAKLLQKYGMEVTVKEKQLTMKGDLKTVYQNVLIDADYMVFNDGAKIRERYDGTNERLVMFTWWRISGALDKSLKREEKFKQALLIDTIRKKGIEQAYNYYGVEMHSVKEKLIPMILSLIFYVIYTIWYGYAILYLFEGLGLKIGH